MLSSVVDTIFLDLDGPVLDGIDKHYQCYCHILESYQLTTLDKSTYFSNKRKRLSTLEQLKASNAEQCYPFFSSHWKALIEQESYLNFDVIQPNAKETIRYWIDSGIDVILVTMRHNKDNLYWQLKQLDLFTLFKKIIAVDPINNKDSIAKASAVISYAKEELNSSCLWIGDTEADILSAKKLEIPIWAVSCGLRDRAFLLQLEPDYLGDSLYEFFDRTHI